MSRSGQDALVDVREWTGCPPGCPGVVGRPLRMSGSCRQTLLDVRELWEALQDVRECSGGSPKCPGVVGRPSRMSGCGREALPDVRKWSKDPPGCPGAFERPSWMSGSGREALPDVRECREALTHVRKLLRGPLGSPGGRLGSPGGNPRCPVVVGWPFRMSGSGREALPDIRECWEALTHVRRLLGGPLGSPGEPPGCPEVVNRPSRKSVRNSRMSGSGREALPNVRECLGDSP